MARQILKTLDLTALLVALDHFEEHGPPAVTPDPYAGTAGCVYLAYIGDEHLHALTTRLPHATVRFRTMATGPRAVVDRPVFDRAAVLYVLRFCFPGDDSFLEFVRDLAPINPRRWSLLDAAGKTVPRPRPPKS